MTVYVPEVKKGLIEYLARHPRGFELAAYDEVSGLEHRQNYLAALGLDKQGEIRFDGEKVLPGRNKVNYERMERVEADFLERSSKSPETIAGYCRKTGEDRPIVHAVVYRALYKGRLVRSRSGRGFEPPGKRKARKKHKRGYALGPVPNVIYGEGLECLERALECFDEDSSIGYHKLKEKSRLPKNARIVSKWVKTGYLERDGKIYSRTGLGIRKLEAIRKRNKAA